MTVNFIRSTDCYFCDKRLYFWGKTKEGKTLMSESPNENVPHRCHSKISINDIYGQLNILMDMVRRVLLRLDEQALKV